MTITDEQLTAASQANEPPRVVDPKTAREYVLIPAEVYSRLCEAADDSGVRDFYPAIDRACAEIWNEPKMNDYDRYEDFKK